MNKIKIAGTVLENPVFSHELFGEEFYTFRIESGRTSGEKDVLNCIVSETLVNDVEEYGKYICAGEIRTRNVFNETGKKNLEVYVFVKEIAEWDGADFNEVTINGFICKEPTYRETPLGRQIGDFLVASNRDKRGQSGYTKSDYIPCIAWSRNALRVANMSVGTEINLVGRFQSREYVKHLEDGAIENRVAYEVSTSRIDVVNKGVEQC